MGSGGNFRADCSMQQRPLWGLSRLRHFVALDTDMLVPPQKNNNIKILKVVLAPKMLGINVKKNPISLSRQLALRTEEVQQHVFLFAHVAFGINPINLYKWQEWLWITMMIDAAVQLCIISYLHQFFHKTRTRLVHSNAEFATLPTYKTLSIQWNTHKQTGRLSQLSGNAAVHFDTTIFRLYSFYFCLFDLLSLPSRFKILQTQTPLWAPH